jgi:5S rRNA maturation endonuclease (ribonuclease M5)
MSEKSYQAIREYQASKTKLPKIKPTKDLFDRSLVDRYVLNLLESQLKSFSEERGIPINILKRHKIGWDGYAYTLPIYQENGFLIGFRRKIPGGDTISKKGSQAGLFNVECLKAASYGVIIYICEGEWDAMALEAQGYEYVVGVPGAFTFMKEWLHLFKDRHVVILYDADQTGQSRSKVVAKMLTGFALSVKNVDLSKILSRGKDVRDFFNGNR